MEPFNNEDNLDHQDRCPDARGGRATRFRGSAARGGPRVGGAGGGATCADAMRAPCARAPAAPRDRRACCCCWPSSSPVSAARRAPRHQVPEATHPPDDSLSAAGCGGNPDAKRLYDDLLSNYNKLVRPVLNVSDALTVRIKLKLSQLIDVVSGRLARHPRRWPPCDVDVFFSQNLKNQIMTTNLWVEQVSARRRRGAPGRSVLTRCFFSELVRLQAVLGAPRVWWRRDAARAVRPHLAPRHRALQQVSAEPGELAPPIA